MLPEQHPSPRSSLADATSVGLTSVSRFATGRSTFQFIRRGIEEKGGGGDRCAVVVLHFSDNVYLRYAGMVMQEKNVDYRREIRIEVC